MPASRSDGEELLRIVDLSFDVVRVDVPITGRRESRKIWNHVDELRAEASLVARLARNGLRVGAASTGAWPAMLTVFEAAGAEFRRDELFPQRGLPLTVGLESIVQPEAVFSYNDGGRLVGKTFAEGDKVVNIDYVFHPELGRVTETRATFEIRHDRGVMTWQRHGGIVRQVPAYDRHVFSDLAVTLTLKPGEFLVIGANPEAQSPYLVGNRFLLSQHNGQPRETLLLITPHPYQTEAPKQEPL